MSVLGIDETRRGKLKWEQDQATGRWRIAHDRWHSGIVDADGTGGLLAHIDGRTAASVTQWLAAQPLSWRQGVTHVAIDPSTSYARAVADALPDAFVVADRFHLVASPTTWSPRSASTPPAPPAAGGAQARPRVGRPAAAADRARAAHPGRVRQAVERPDRRRRPRHRDPARLHRQGGPAVPAGPGRHHPDKAQIRDHPWRFYTRAAASSSPEIHRLAATIEAWWPAVEAAITTGYSNARSEGYNRLAKHQGRNAFGFRNVENHRRRIRSARTRQHRRASAATSEVPGQVR